MKAYCINLDRRPDRRDYMWSEFRRLGIDVELVSAVDGSLPEIAEKVASLSPGFRGAQLGTGAYACFQSHRLCWQKLVESGDPCAMVLEDDVVVADGIVDCLADGWMPADADIAKLETRDVRIHVSRKKLPIGRGRYLSRLVSTFFGTACYVISRKAAQRLLQLTSDFVDNVDEVLFHVDHPVSSALTIYQMDPAPAVQGHLAKHHEISGTWSQSSIDVRRKRDRTDNALRETPMQRLKRRLGEEGRALVRGTRYVVIPHR